MQALHDPSPNLHPGISKLVVFPVWGRNQPAAGCSEQSMRWASFWQQGEEGKAHRGLKGRKW